MLISNFIPFELKESIKLSVLHKTFPWYWNESQIYDHLPSNESIAGFTHIAYANDKIDSGIYELFYKVLFCLENKLNFKVKSVYRIQANLLTNQIITEQQDKNQIHIDHINPNMYSLVYYVIDSDGDTLIYDDNGDVAETCNPIAGNAVLFKSNLKHQASLPKLNKRRIVINYIFEVDNNIIL
jgi:hypothetical protein